MGTVRAVLLDWRGTLATTLTEPEWVEQALRRLDRPAEPPEVAALAGRLAAVAGDLIRPALAAAGLDGLVDAVTLSFEEGTQKPDPAMWLRTLDRLGVLPEEAVVVGDRAGPDGGAVEAGLVTLLLPPLRSPADRRLHHVLALCGVAVPPS